MIDSMVFRTSRELARGKLPIEIAKNSFGYYIDIPNGWESYRSPEELVGFLGIHTTHAAQYLEIIEDLGVLTEQEHDWVRRYVKFYNSIAGILASTGKLVELKHDIAETIFDWRTILKFTNMPCRVLDYGAGCARQGTSAFLRNRDNIYVAVDSTLAAYTIQNLVLSYMTANDPGSSFNDFLDFEFVGKPFPQVATAKPANRFHIPAWIAEAHIPSRFFDVVISVHVHNELSGPDFLRLIHAIDKGLADNGIAYVRSELTAFDTKDWFDSVDLHGLDIVEILRGKGIVPVYCKYDSAFITTVFARIGSTHYNAALKSGKPENSFMEIKKGTDVSQRAGEHFIERMVKRASGLGRRTAIIGDGCHFFDQFLKPALGDFRNKEVFKEADFTGDAKEATERRLKAFNPEVVIIASFQLFEIEAEMKKMIPDVSFPLRQKYWYPVSFLFTRSANGTDPIFDHSIMCVEDIKR